jgi:hypothetical protein
MVGQDCVELNTVLPMIAWGDFFEPAVPASGAQPRMLLQSSHRRSQPSDRTSSTLGRLHPPNDQRCA